ncbi:MULTISPECIES: hypothetical protein [Glutamicibacter]|uniref:hypothetical protein n=1 Tax=Glutamicibacter TaxID=1742989 RepID=UPI0019582746|nr:hypothetical protein [Glutamicibacter nicotianae]MBM7766829.1 peptidoglycan/LPS O-acetylase OafA/YrhL [Glutamicibacter nicotianae]
MKVSANILVGKCPLWTWVLMGLALASALALIDWADTGTAKPLWMFLLPTAFGLLGGIVAALKKSFGWALISLAFGLLVVQLLSVVVTVVQGP